MDSMNYYTGIKKIYFNAVLRRIVKIGNLNDKKVLDFGCGTRQLIKFLKNNENYIGYDINTNKDVYSDVDDFRKANFDIAVINEVFYEMTPRGIEDALIALKSHELVVGISRQGLLNKAGSVLFAPYAYDKAITSPSKELEILKKFCRIKKHSSVFGLTDIYLLEYL